MTRTFAAAGASRTQVPRGPRSLVARRRQPSSLLALILVVVIAVGAPQIRIDNLTPFAPQGPLNKPRGWWRDRWVTGGGDADQLAKIAVTTAVHQSRSSPSFGGSPPMVFDRGRGTRISLAVSLTTAPG